MEKRSRSNSHVVVVWLRLLLAASIALPAVLPQVVAAQKAATAGVPFDPTVVRFIPLARHGVTNPEGLAYSPDAGVFLLSQGADAGTEQLTVAAVTPFDDLTATTNMAAGVADPVNSTVDAGRNRLLLLDSQAQQLIEVDIDLEGRVLPETMSRTNIGGLTLSDARGLYVDPDTSNLYILDNGARQIVVVRPGSEQSYGDILAAGADQATRISLAPLGNASLRGIAVHPLTGHIFVLGPEQARMYELSATGELISTYDLAHLGVSTPRALIIARSADLTDAPTQMHVYVVDGGARSTALPTGANRLYLPGIFAGPGASTAGLETSTQARLAELTFEAVPDLAAAAVAAVSVAPLLRTIDTSPFPAPDPSGIAYNSSTNRLVTSDAEVEEMAIFTGNNVYETSLSGSLLRSSDTIAFSSEPTGVAYNPLNNHTFFSDDDKKKVNEVDPKADGLINTGDDVVTSLVTSAFGSMDPEGVAYSPALNMLFIADGVNAEVYKVAPGPNGLFDGSDDLVTHFDTESLGITDPEGIEWNPDSGTLYVVGKPETAIGELTTNGALVRMHDISAANAYKPAGLAYGPASHHPSLRSIYIVDRNVDNATDPNENDGKIYEMSLGSVTPGNQAPVVNAGPDQIITQVQAATLAGSATDDGIPNPPGSVSAAWTKASGPGTVTFANASAASTTATFSSVGTYVLHLLANDGELVSDDEVKVIVTDVNGQATTQVRITVSSDDAEQRSNGSVSLTSSDLQLTTYNGGAQVVGLRFAGVEVPKGATIVDANIQFMADEASSVATNLIIFGQDAGNPATFTSTSNSISTRPRTAASVAWAPPGWPTVGAAGADQRTPPLTTIVQSLTNRSDWSAGNAMAFIITGTGSHVAESADGSPASGAPLLTITYQLGANAAPSVSAGPDQTITLPATAALAGTVSDDGLPNLPGAVSVTWSQISGPGTTTFAPGNAVNTTASFSAAGTYILRLTANDSALSASDDIQVTVSSATGTNAAPSVSAGPDQTITLPATAALAGTVSDDDLPNPPATVTTAWSVVSGPGTVTFVNAGAVDTTASFSAAGTYVLRLTANDGALSASDDIQVTVNSAPPANAAPSVSAGPDQTITLPATAALAGTVSDDDLPNPPATVTTAWSVVSGPGTVTFANAGAVDTTASFSAAGTYILRLTANDGALSASDDIQVTVSSATGTNAAPSVSAGPDQTITLPATAALAGTVSDDDLPNPPATVTTAWSVVSGPGTVTFINAGAVDTTASFSAAGTYILRLTANDGQLVGSDEVTVTVIGATAALAVTNSPVTYDGTPQAATVVGSVPGTVSGILYDGSATVPVDAGSYAVTANFVPDDTTNYDSVSGADAGTFVIGKAATATTVTCPAGPFTYTGAAIEPCTASVTGPGGLDQAVAVTYASNVNAGTATATATYAESANYLPSSDSETFVIGKAAALAVTNSPVTYDGTPQAATVVGSVPGTVSGILYDGSATVPVDAGSYAVTANFVPDDTTNYDSVSGADAGTFVIGKAATATTVTCPAGPFTYTGAPIEPCTASVTGPGGLNQAVAVTYANNVNAAGTATATATYAGGTNYLPSSDTETFVIGAATETTILLHLPYLSR